MAIARTLTRRLTTIAYSANNTVPTQLNVTGKVRRLWLRLTATLNVTATATTITQNPGTIVPSLILRFNEQTILKSGRWLDWVDRGYVFTKLPTEVAAAGVVASYSVTSLIELPFITPGGIRPIDTILVIGDNDRLDLDITWADENQLVAGGTKAFTTNPVISVMAEMINDVRVEPVAIYKEQAFENGSLGTGANTDYQGLQMVTGPGINYHHLIVVTEDLAATSLRARVSNINQIQLQSTGQGIVSTPFGQMTGPELQEDFNAWHTRVSAVRAGVYPVLFQPEFEGRMTYNLVTADLDDLRFILNQATFATDGVDRVVYGTVEPLAV
jgi:hypothetical protein